MATRVEWAKRLKRWRKSGLSLEEFAAKEKLKVELLKWWRWRLGDSVEESTEESAPRFLPVQVVETKGTAPWGTKRTAPAEWIEIALPNGRVVRAQPGFDPETLERVLSIASGTVPC